MFLGHVKACCIANGGTEPYHKLSNAMVGIKAGILMWTLREELKEQDIRRDRGPKRETENWEEAGRNEWRKEWKNKGRKWHLVGEIQLSKMGASSPVLKGKALFVFFFLSAFVPQLCSICMHTLSLLSTLDKEPNCLRDFPNVAGCQSSSIAPFNFIQNHRLFCHLLLNLVPGPCALSVASQRHEQGQRTLSHSFLLFFFSCFVFERKF